LDATLYRLYLPGVLKQQHSTSLQLTSYQSTWPDAWMQACGSASKPMQTNTQTIIPAQAHLSQNCPISAGPVHSGLMATMLWPACRGLHQKCTRRDAEWWSSADQSQGSNQALAALASDSMRACRISMRTVHITFKSIWRPACQHRTRLLNTLYGAATRACKGRCSSCAMCTGHCRGINPIHACSRTCCRSLRRRA
jgi:hypothetical protein